MTAPTARDYPAFSPKARAFLQSPRFAIVATLNPNGGPLQAVIWYRLEDDAIVFNSRAGRRWPTNLERDGRVSILVSDGYSYVEMRGTVEIDADPARGQEVIAGLAERYRESDDGGEEQLARFAAEARVTFTLRPTHIFERLSD
jgi:PPOX class probable F420-dependent enzyme